MFDEDWYFLPDIVDEINRKIKEESILNDISSNQDLLKKLSKELGNSHAINQVFVQCRNNSRQTFKEMSIIAQKKEILKKIADLKNIQKGNQAATNNNSYYESSL